MIHKQFQKMKMTEDEKKKGRVKVDESDLLELNSETQFMAACKILTSRIIIAEYFKANMPKIWGLKDNIRIEKAGRNTFICKFRNKRDKSRIVEGGHGFTIKLSLCSIRWKEKTTQRL